MLSSGTDKNDGDTHPTKVPHPRQPLDNGGWLGLLASDSTLENAEAHRQQLLEIAAEQDLAEIERQSGQAIAILMRLAERRQHSDELTVLNDLARRLASLHESRDVLQEVSSQARRLLSADIAYLMLRQGDRSEDGSGGNQLCIEVSDGSLGSMLPGLEIGVGEGLGGQVLRAGKPLWTEDYLHDSLIAHVGHVDEAATSEHLGGILGVPLNVGDETLGVLLAANRHPRKFTSREIELLAALAAHASVAIRNAKLYELQQRSETELRKAISELKATNDTRQQAFDLRERLTQIMISGGTSANILAELQGAISTTVRFEDADNHEFAALFATSTSDAPFTGTISGLHRVAVPVMLSTGYGGCLVADSATPLGGEALRLLPLGATSLAILIASDRSLAEVELRTRSEFMNTLLWSQSGEDSVKRHALAVGIAIDRVSAVAVIAADPGTKDADDARRLAVRLAQQFHGWSGQHAEHIVVLLPNTAVTDVKKHIERLVHGCFPGAIGLSPSQSGIQGVRDAHLAALQTTIMLNALGRPHEVAEASELGIYRAVFSQAGRDEISMFVTHCVGRLLDYDREHRRSLASTLSMYFELSQHHARTCAALHIHANTLYNRLERIDSLIGPGWKESTRSLDIQLALRLNGLIRNISTGPDTLDH